MNSFFNTSILCYHTVMQIELRSANCSLEVSCIPVHLLLSHELLSGRGLIAACLKIVGTLPHPSQTLPNHAKMQGREIPLLPPPPPDSAFVFEIHFTISFFSLFTIVSRLRRVVMNAGKNQRLIQGSCRLFWEPPDPRHNRSLLLAQKLRLNTLTLLFVSLFKMIGVQLNVENGQVPQKASKNITKVF